jgi:hypothetical protein
MRLDFKWFLYSGRIRINLKNNVTINLPDDYRRLKEGGFEGVLIVEK